MLYMLDNMQDARCKGKKTPPAFIEFLCNSCLTQKNTVEQYIEKLNRSRRMRLMRGGEMNKMIVPDKAANTVASVQFN